MFTICLTLLLFYGFLNSLMAQQKMGMFMAYGYKTKILTSPLGLFFSP